MTDEFSDAVSDDRPYHEPRQIRVTDLEENDVALINNEWRLIHETWISENLNAHLEEIEAGDLTEEETVLIRTYLKDRGGEFTLVRYFSNDPNDTRSPTITVPMRACDLITVQAAVTTRPSRRIRSGDRPHFEPRKLRVKNLIHGDVALINNKWRWVHSTRYAHLDPQPVPGQDDEPASQQPVAVPEPQIPPRDFVTVIEYYQDTLGDTRPPTATISMRSYNLITVQAPLGLIPAPGQP